MIAKKLSPLALIAALAACTSDEPTVSASIAADDESQHDERPMLLDSRDVATVKAWLDADQDAPPVASSVMSSAAKVPSAPPISSMISGLEKKLEANPGDRNGWVLLAQSYAFMGQMESAWSAAARAIELGADETEVREKILVAHGADPSRTGGG